MHGEHGSAKGQVLSQDIHYCLGTGTCPKEMLHLLERSHLAAGCICSLPPTNTSQTSCPGDTMATRTRDSMQEQTPPDLLPLITQRSLHTSLILQGRSLEKWLAWGEGSGAGREAEARATAEQAHRCQAACLAARSEESWRAVTRRTVKLLEERLRWPWAVCHWRGPWPHPWSRLGPCKPLCC